MSRPGHLESPSTPIGDFLPVAWSILWASLAIRLAGCIVFSSWLPVDHLVLPHVVSVGLYLFSIHLLRRGRFHVFVVATAFEWTFWSDSMSAVFGVGSQFQIYFLLLPFSALAFVHIPTFVRAAMVMVPLAIFFPRYQTHAELEPQIDLGRATLARVAAANLTIVAVIVLLIVVQVLRMAARARRRAEELATSKSQLIDDMSHELRTPTATLLAASQGALLQDRSVEELRRTLVLVERNATSLAKLIERMLELSRLEWREIELRNDATLQEAVRDCVKAHEGQAMERSLRLECELETSRQETDSAILDVVLGNLLANAIRYSPERETVLLTLRETASETVLAVSDSGPGIPKEDLDRIFDRYWRADRTRSRKEGHHGLGLAIARRYAALLGARIEVRSVVGEGTTFRVVWSA